MQRVVANTTLSNGLGPWGDRMYFVHSTEQRIDIFTWTRRRGRSAIGDAWHGSTRATLSPAVSRLTHREACGCARSVAARCAATTTGVHSSEIVQLPVTNLTCPAFGGPGLRTMYVTIARQGLSVAQLVKEPTAGAVLS